MLNIIPILFIYTLLVIFRIIQWYISKDFPKKYMLLEPIVFIIFIFWLGFLNHFLMQYIKFSKEVSLIFTFLIYMLAPIVYISLKRSFLLNSYKLFSSKSYLPIEFLAYIVAFGITTFIKYSLAAL